MILLLRYECEALQQSANQLGRFGCAKPGQTAKKTAFRILHDWIAHWIGLNITITRKKPEDISEIKGIIAKELKDGTVLSIEFGKEDAEDDNKNSNDERDK